MFLMRLETLKCVFEACVSEFYSVGRNWRNAMCVKAYNEHTPSYAILTTLSEDFWKSGKSQPPACSVSGKGLSLRLKRCFN